jgi:hypothetical protein
MIPRAANSAKQSQIAKSEAAGRGEAGGRAKQSQFPKNSQQEGAGRRPNGELRETKPIAPAGQTVGTAHPTRQRRSYRVKQSQFPGGVPGGCNPGDKGVSCPDRWDGHIAGPELVFGWMV